MPLLSRLERVLGVDETELQVDQLVVALLPAGDQHSLQHLHYHQHCRQCPKCQYCQPVNPSSFLETSTFLSITNIINIVNIEQLA